MHSLIERAMKNKVLYTPDQVYGVIMNAKITGEKYNLIEMGQSDFYNIKDLIIGKNWTTDTQGSKIAWTKIVEVKVSNSNPNIVQFKYNYDDQYFDLNTESCINRSRRGKQNRSGNIEVTSLKPAYSEPIAVSKALLEDLHSLCRTEAIPAHYHSFYNSLRSYNDNQQPASDSDSDDDNDRD
ncbi:hypothetical protein B5X24_HaOG201740 [Helicoverpa armigera]|nr:hypothetical protein B5X24_HaOG201740 [Helicoverpa armigera]